MKWHLVFSPEISAQLTEALADRGWEVTGTDATLEQFRVAAEGGMVHADVALIDGTAGIVDKRDCVRLLREVRALLPDLRLIVLLPAAADREWIRALGHLGIYDVYAVGHFTAEDVVRWAERRKTIADVPGETDLPDGKVEPSGIRLAPSGRPKERVVVEERIVGCVPIAVGGVGARSGATHVALSMAVWLAREGFQTAVVECRGESLAALRTDVAAAAPGGFRWEGTDVFTALGAPWIPILSAGYQYVVLDFGDLTAAGETDEMEFMRCPLRFLVTGVSAWDLARTFSALGRWKEKYPAQEWNVALNFADEAKYREVAESLLPREKKALKLRFWHVPFYSDPARPPDLGEWLSPVLPRRKSKRFSVRLPVRRPSEAVDIEDFLS